VPLLFVALVGCSADRRKTSDEAWGGELNGLRIGLTNTNPGLDRHILVLTFQNVGRDEIQWWYSGVWPNTLYQCFDRDGRIAELTSEGTNLIRRFSPGGDRSLNYLRKLSPGESHSIQPVNIESLYKLSAGRRYTVRAIYEEHQEGGWSGAITSNVVEIQVDN